MTLRSLDASRNALSSMHGVGRLVRLEQLLLEHNQIEVRVRVGLANPNPNP